MCSALRALAVLLSIVAVTVSGALSAQPRGDTLEIVRSRGHLICGVDNENGGFAHHDANGRWSGLEADVCQALAVAVFGRKDAVRFRLMPPAERYKALKAGEIDVLAAHTSWTMTRDSALGLRYAATVLYDGTALMVRRRQGVASTLELSGGSICALEGPEGAQIVRDYFNQRRMRIRAMTTSERWDTLVKAYLANQCTALAGDATMLARSRTRFEKPDDHVLLPERLAIDPIGLLVCEGSERWFSVVRWTVHALIGAEEAGITSGTVDAMDAASAPSLAARRFLGLEGQLGRELGLKGSWTRDVIRNVGNFAEIYDRNFGQLSAFKIPRGLNNLWSKGGLMVAPSFR
jgi:general L-amino acid transport system substrate-binding protein